MRKILLESRKKAISLWALVSFLILSSYDVFGTNKVQNSQFFKGTQKLIKDLLLAGQVLSGTIAAAVLVYLGITYILKKDEMDEKALKRKALWVIIVLILILLVAEFIKLIAGYYNVNPTI